MSLKTISIHYIPFRAISCLFVVFTNSDYASFIGNDAGFFCDDESIKQPYHGDTIRAAYLFLILLGIFSIIVYLSELICKPSQDKAASRSQCRLYLKYYFTGFIYVLASTEVVKICFTKLRPHFFYTCLPDMRNIDCSKGLITEFNCTGDESHWLINRDIYKSFPSGHSALSVYAFVFMCFYLHSKRNTTKVNSMSTWWSRLVFVSCFLWTILCCVSRVLDNRHFWLDVLSGAAIGLVGGLATVSIAVNKAKISK